jgi:hypothetical protein
MCTNYEGILESAQTDEESRKAVAGDFKNVLAPISVDIIAIDIDPHTYSIFTTFIYRGQSRKICYLEGSL